MITVKYYTKNVYGKTLKYLQIQPGNESSEENEVPRAILALINKQTIDDRDIYLLERLGINFERVFEPM